MAGATIIIRGLRQAFSALERTKRGSTVPDIIGTMVVAGVKQNFVRGEDPDTGKTWDALKGRHGQPLRDKGRLMRSIHHEKRGSGYSAKVYVGTNLIYAATHQFGDPNRVPKNARMLFFKIFGVTVAAHKVSIPMRRYLPLTSKGLDRTAPALRPSLEKYLRNSWT